MSEKINNKWWRRQDRATGITEQVFWTYALDKLKDNYKDIIHTMNAADVNCPLETISAYYWPIK